VISRLSIHPKIIKRDICVTQPTYDITFVLFWRSITVLEPGRYETDVSQGQVGEREVHGGMKVRVRTESQDDEQVFKHCDQVCRQEHPKENRPQLWVF
jgi:hypothetical protein